MLKFNASTQTVAAGRPIGGGTYAHGHDTVADSVAQILAALRRADVEIGRSVCDCIVEDTVARSRLLSCSAAHNQRAEQMVLAQVERLIKAVVREKGLPHDGSHEYQFGSDGVGEGYAAIEGRHQPHAVRTAKDVSPTPAHYMERVARPGDEAAVERSEQEYSRYSHAPPTHYGSTPTLDRPPSATSSSRVGPTAGGGVHSVGRGPIDPESDPKTQLFSPGHDSPPHQASQAEQFGPTPSARSAAVVTPPPAPAGVGRRPVAEARSDDVLVVSGSESNAADLANYRSRRARSYALQYQRLLSHTGDGDD